ncbi:Pre-mRNA-processing factor 19 [Bulinus truncatus]|nr:Pre-mRNA-processing factor 19 [Bulinus truncatus]
MELIFLLQFTGYNAPAPNPSIAADAGPESAIQPAEEAVMSDEVIKKLQDKATLLTAERKKLLPEGLATSDDIRNYRPISFSYGSSLLASVPEVIAKRSTVVIYHPEEELVITASPDNTIRVWGITTASCGQIIRAHDAPVTGISLHATGDYLLSCSTDMHWAFSDIRTGRILTKIVGKSDQITSALTCAQFHPDGLIFGTGTDDSIIKIWDLKERSNVANFQGHQGHITSISFSENGYYLATSAEDSVVKLWDLRKLKNFKTIQLEDNYQVKGLCFDQSGTYLAVAGSDVRVYLCKQWSELAVFNDHTAAATGVRFGHNSSFIVSVSMDRSVKFFGTAD